MCKQEPPPEPSESDEMIPDNPQPAKTEEEAREYFEKEERLRKVICALKIHSFVHIGLGEKR